MKNFYREKEWRKNKTELYNYETDLHNRVKKVQEYKSNLIALEEEARAKKYEKFQNDRELQRFVYNYFASD